MNWLLVEENVKRALNEDLQYGDITTESVVLDHKIAKVDIIAKEKRGNSRYRSFQNGL